MELKMGVGEGLGSPREATGITCEWPWKHPGVGGPAFILQATGD